MHKDKIDEVLLPVPFAKAKRREQSVRENFWPKFKSYAIRLPFAEDVAAAFYCATDKKTPLKVRGTLLAALAYFILPLDLVPDILALVGFTDDIAVLTAAIGLVQTHVTDDHRQQARDAMKEIKEAAP